MRLMGRRRKSNLSLPPRMHQKHGAYYHVVFDSQVGRQRWVLLAKDFGSALRLYAEREAREYAGETMADLIQRFVLEIAPTKRPSTYRNYTAQSKVLGEVFGAMRIRDVKPVHVGQFLDVRPKKVQANREVALLSVMFRWAKRWGWADLNPCEGVSRHQVSKRRRLLSDDELARLAAALPAGLRPIVELAYLTAVRKGDLLALRWSQVDATGITVTPEKTSDSTGVTLHFRRGPRLNAALTELASMRRGTGNVRRIQPFLFTKRTGGRYTVSGFDSIWQRAMKRAGVLDAHFHDIRRRRLTDLKRERGVEAAQDAAGHASVKTTEGYVQGVEIVEVETG